MKLAVVGSGISGLTCAHLLAEDHEVTIFEAGDYAGGHTNTRQVTLRGRAYAVDTGFIVFNEENYPNFVKLLKRLKVSWQLSDMSFSVRAEENGLEYCPSSLGRLFAQRRNLLRPAFYRMIRDAVRFRRESPAVLEPGAAPVTLADYLAENGYSRWFKRYFILPMGSAIWSAPPRSMERFPARQFVQFFANHRFLDFREQPAWRTVAGGSQTYVAALLRATRCRLRLNCPVLAVSRRPDGVTLALGGGATESFDEVVLATHSDQALALLADRSDAEGAILGALPYQKNDTVLHTDTRVLPRRRRAWASWNYLLTSEGEDRATVTYNMNSLQRLEAPETLCVTLNDTGRIRPETILYRAMYEHVQFTPEGIEAQKRHAEISGRRHTHYCGAYWGYGFHEDGVRSALAVCRRFGKGL